MSSPIDLGSILSELGPPFLSRRRAHRLPAHPIREKDRCGVFFSAIVIAALGLACDGASAFPVKPLVAAPDGTIIRVDCKYGTSHCVNPSPGPTLPTVGGAGLPDNGWTDPDCKHYGNCDTGTPTSGNPTGWGDPSLSRSGVQGAKPAGSKPVLKSR